jgi:hypothetical protein
VKYVIERVYVRAGLRAKIPPVRSSTGCATFGTLLAAAGTPVADLRGLMGHASLATTQGYLDSVTRDRQEAAASQASSAGTVERGPVEGRDPDQAALPDLVALDPAQVDDEAVATPGKSPER